MLTGAPASPAAAAMTKYWPRISPAVRFRRKRSARGGAEPAAHGAARLGGQAEGAAVFLRDEHGLDPLAVGQPEEEFLAAVGRAAALQHPGQLQRGARGQLLAEIPGQVGHSRQVEAPAAVEVPEELRPAEGGLSPPRHQLAEFCGVFPISSTRSMPRLYHKNDPGDSGRSRPGLDRKSLGIESVYRRRSRSMADLSEMRMRSRESPSFSISSPLLTWMGTSMSPSEILLAASVISSIGLVSRPAVT